MHPRICKKTLLLGAFGRDRNQTGASLISHLDSRNGLRSIVRPAVKCAQHRAGLVSVCLAFGAFVMIYTEIVIQWNLRATRHEQVVANSRNPAAWSTAEGWRRASLVHEMIPAEWDARD